VPVGLELADFGHVAADRDFGSVAESVDVRVVGVGGSFAAFETPVGSDDLCGQEDFDGSDRLELGFELFGDCVVDGSEDEFEGEHWSVFLFQLG